MIGGGRLCRCWGGILVMILGNGLKLLLILWNWIQIQKIIFMGLIGCYDIEG
jgi:hypothetical protein